MLKDGQFWMKELTKWILGNIQKEIKLREDKLPELLIIGDLEIREAYLEYYSITLLGFNNASIVLAGILMEKVAKAIYLFQTGKIFEGNFDQAIIAIKTYITKEERKFLLSVKEWRNLYAHGNENKIVPSEPLDVHCLTFDKEGGKMEHLKTTINNPLFSSIFKQEIDKEKVYEVCEEIHKFLKEINRKYLQKPKVRTPDS